MYGSEEKEDQKNTDNAEGGRAELQVKVGDGKVEEGIEEVYRM